MIPRKVRGWAYNCVVNRQPYVVEAALRHIKNENPYYNKFVVLIESNQYDNAINEVFPGYRQICYRKGGLKDKNTRLLIKKKWYERLEVDFIHCNESWNGPQGGLQPGRVFPVGILGRGKKRLVIIGIHLAWNGNGKNKKAAQEEHNKLNIYIKSLPPTYSVLAMGDWNRGESTVSTYIDVKKWKVLRGTPKGVDHTGAINIDGTANHGEKYGSDHPLQLVRCND